ncbi:MAG: acyl-CoA desaturase [Myxococcota bacterium]
MTLVFVAVHAAALSALLVAPTTAALALLLGWFALAGFGITVGYHRLLSHASFRCGRWTRRGFALLGALALQGGPAFWVGLHRRHHADADREGDPHSPHHGLLEGHMLWMLRRSTKNAAVLAALSYRDLREIGRDPLMPVARSGRGPAAALAGQRRGVRCGRRLAGCGVGGARRTVVRLARRGSSTA